LLVVVGTRGGDRVLAAVRVEVGVVAGTVLPCLHVDLGRLQMVLEVIINGAARHPRQPLAAGIDVVGGRGQGGAGRLPSG